MSLDIPRKFQKDFQQVLLIIRDSTKTPAPHLSSSSYKHTNRADNCFKSEKISDFLMLIRWRLLNEKKIVEY